MPVEFYNVKKRKKVSIDDVKITKTKYTRTLKDGSTQIRYAFKAQDDDGSNLTKFCNQQDWENISAPEV